MFLSVRIWQGKNGTESEDVLVNLDHVTDARRKSYWDTAEEAQADAAEVVLSTGTRMLLGSTLEAIQKASK